ncbi:25080_t:CDS:2 [Cetraspora pellucida]|uniref:25080_t:CDS:1 n=1 Tax=Cetraspora pellucida TaxID=1433469 RepID=A0A9N8VHW4_9GLOM|nr:25080_t:CDS:2 [Cetraspora pellucida]
MTNSSKVSLHNLNSSQFKQVVNEKKSKKSKNKGKKGRNAYPTVTSSIPMACKEQNCHLVPLRTSENYPSENCLPVLPRCNDLPIPKLLNDQNRKDSINTKEHSSEETNLIEINLPPNCNSIHRFHRVIKIDEIGKIMIKIIHPDNSATYLMDIINQSNTSEIKQPPSIIPDYIVIKIPGMDFPVLVYPNHDECGNPMVISMDSHSKCSICSPSSSLENLDKSSICPKELSHTMSRDHVPSDTVSETVNDVQPNLSSSDCLLDATSSTFEIEINSKVQSTTTCFPNEQYNIQESSFDVNLPPHGCYHINGVNGVNGFNDNTILIENFTNDMFQLSENEIVSSSELDLTPDGLMVKLPTNSNKQLKIHSKAPVPSIVTKNLPTTFVEEEYADDDGSELPRSSLSSPHSTISSTSFSMSVLSTTSTYAESINTVISTSYIQTIDKSIISSSTYSASSSFNHSPEFKANDDHIADQYFDEIPYKQESGNLCYLSERSISPEHLSPVMEEDETLIAIQNSQVSDCSTLNDYDIKQLSDSEDQHIDSHAQDDSDLEHSCDECIIKSEINSEVDHYSDNYSDNYPDNHCSELDAIDEYMQTLNLENKEEEYEAIRLRHQLKIIREAPYPVELPLSNSCCSTVPELCEQYKALTSYIKPSDLKIDSNLNFFKDDIQPMWEDVRNEGGGKLTLCPPRRQLDSLWDTVVMLLAGNMFDCSDNICGAICARRSRGDRVEIWMGSQITSEDVEKIKLQLSKELGSRHVMNLPYKKHHEK